MKIVKSRYIIFFIIIFTSVNEINAQFWKRLNKGTSRREIRKRQEEANKKSDYNKFNALIPMGGSVSRSRTDYIWSYETANTVPEYSGDISIFSPTRLSIRTGHEFGTSIASLPFIPMVYYKKRWSEGKYYIASRHEAYSFTPGLYFLRSKDKYTFISENSNIPHVIALKNELIISRPFLKELKCGTGKQPFLIVTGAVAYDYGFSLKSTGQGLMDYKFMRTRSGVVLGGGGMFSARIQGDLYLTKGIFLTAALRGLFADSIYGNAIEQNTNIRIGLSPKFTGSIGYWMNFGKGDGTFIVPLIDITYHFGQKEGRQTGLFKRGR